MKGYIEAIREVFDPNNYTVFSMYDMKDRILFGIKDNRFVDEEPLDPYYTLDKKTLRIKGFAPHHDKEGFKYAIEHEIYFNHDLKYE